MKKAWTFDQEGWLDGAERRLSPHYNDRPDGEALSLIVLHNISLPPGKFEGEDVDALFMGTLETQKDPFYRTLEGLRVSSHFVIRRNGVLRQYVSVLKRAWHAGVSRWQGKEGCNDFSVGIELEGDDSSAFTPEQYATLKRLLLSLEKQYHLRTVTGHQHIAPERKTDPGPFFDWDGLAQNNPDVLIDLPKPTDKVLS